MARASLPAPLEGYMPSARQLSSVEATPQRADSWELLFDSTSGSWMIINPLFLEGYHSAHMHACSVTLVMSNSLWPIDCNPPGSSIQGILQAGILEWAAMPSSMGIFLAQGSNLGLFHLLHRQAGFLPPAPPGKPVREPTVGLPWCPLCRHRTRVTLTGEGPDACELGKLGLKRGNETRGWFLSALFIEMVLIKMDFSLNKEIWFFKDPLSSKPSSPESSKCIVCNCSK